MQKFVVIQSTVIKAKNAEDAIKQVEFDGTFDFPDLMTCQAFREDEKIISSHKCKLGFTVE